MDKKQKFLRNNGFQTVLASLICIIIGFIIGFVVLLIISPAGAGKAITAILKNFFYYPNAAAATKYFGTTLIKASALLMCALSVIFAYKVGLFNIGAAGQYVIGAGGCLYMALKFNMPWYVCLITAVVMAALIGGISGALKAYLNVNEVISCIMLNWISLYSINMLLSQVKDGSTPYTKLLFSYNKSAMLPTAGLNELFHNKYMTIGVPMSVIVAIIVWVVLQKTKFGFELKATGINKLAAKYCGMREKRNIIVTMMISGGLAGFGAGIFYLSGIEQWMVQQTSVPWHCNDSSLYFCGAYHCRTGRKFSSSIIYINCRIIAVIIFNFCNDDTICFCMKSCISSIIRRIASSTSVSPSN